MPVLLSVSLMFPLISETQPFLTGFLIINIVVLYYSSVKSFNNSANYDIMLEGDENGNQVCYHSGTKGRN